MRRTAPVVIATVGGLALLASFHTTPGVAHRSATPVVGPTQPPAAGEPPSTGSPSSGSTPTSGPSTPSTARPSSQTIDGPDVPNQFGDVQVRVVVSGGRLVDVQALVLPTDRRRSQEISSAAEPALRQEALQAQSANINILSGATYTSESYAQSLQAALDQAGL